MWERSKIKRVHSEVYWHHRAVRDALDHVLCTRLQLSCIVVLYESSNNILNPVTSEILDRYCLWKCLQNKQSCKDLASLHLHVLPTTYTLSSTHVFLELFLRWWGFFTLDLTSKDILSTELFTYVQLSKATMYGSLWTASPERPVKEFPLKIRNKENDLRIRIRTLYWSQNNKQMYS